MYDVVTSTSSPPLRGSALVAVAKGVRAPLRVTLINHAYVAAENQKNLVALAREVDLQAIVPEFLAGPRLGLESKYTPPLPAEQDGKLELIRRKPHWLAGQLWLQPFGTDLARHRPQIIHAEYAPWSPLSVETLVLAQRRAPNAKLVLTIRKNTYLPQRFPLEQLKRSLCNWVADRTSGYMVESELAAELSRGWLRLPDGRLHLCHQLGVDLDLFRPATEPPRNKDKFVLGYAGRLHENKGIPELVEAAASLVSRRRKLRLRLLGDGPLATTLRQRSLNDSWLSVEGAVEHRAVAEFMRQCDAFAMVSRNEPDHQEHDGHALMEAMAVGLAAIVTRSGVLPDLASDETAIFVRESNVADLRAAIDRLIADEPRRRSMESCARQIAEQRFGLAAVAQRRRAVYEKICHD